MKKILGILVKGTIFTSDYTSSYVWSVQRGSLRSCSPEENRN